MITRQQIIGRAHQDGVPAPTVERDYVLAHCLVAVSRLHEAESLVLKGGAALRMCYFHDYRYSADLDFSLTAGLTREGALQTIGSGLEMVKEEVGFTALGLVTDFATKITYEGPLGKPRWIKLDMDEAEFVFTSVPKPLIPRYEDVPATENLRAYSLAEITAEKLRCVMQRLQCRDLFDLHYLLEVKGTDQDDAWEMFEQKARHKKIDPANFFERFDVRVPQYEERWADEMGEHLGGDLPHFEAIRRELRRRLRPRR